MLRPGLTSLWTLPPPGSPGVPYCLPALGHVQPATYSFTDPGGCDQLTSVIARRHRHEALNAGRTVLAQRGGSVVWSGILDQPVSDGAGSFALSAHGAAGIGTDYRAIYTPPWGTGVFNDAIDQAITRGLPWVRGTNIGAVSGLWTGQAVDSASQSVADLLNLATTKGGLTWQVATGPGWHQHAHRVSPAHRADPRAGRRPARPGCPSRTPPPLCTCGIRRPLIPRTGKPRRPTR